MLLEANIVTLKLKLKDSEQKFLSHKQKLRNTETRLLNYKQELMLKEEIWLTLNLMKLMLWLTLLRELFPLFKAKSIDITISVMVLVLKKLKQEVLLFMLFKEKDSEIIFNNNMEQTSELQLTDKLTFKELIFLVELGLINLVILTLIALWEEKPLILLVASIV